MISCGRVEVHRALSPTPSQWIEKMLTMLGMMHGCHRWFPARQLLCLPRDRARDTNRRGRSHSSPRYPHLPLCTPCEHQFSSPRPARPPSSSAKQLNSSANNCRGGHKNHGIARGKRPAVLPPIMATTASIQLHGQWWHAQTRGRSTWTHRCAAARRRDHAPVLFLTTFCCACSLFSDFIFHKKNFATCACHV